jgi:protoheme IX farnesyltransferase
MVVFLGVFVDFVIYTLWLKRRSPWSIVWGGIAGGMPVLAGRALGVGYLDPVGIWLALGVFFWIPTHIMTFNIRYAEDYRAAGVPTFPSIYGLTITRAVIALSSILAALSMGLAAVGLSVTWGTLRLLAVLSCGLFILAVTSMLRPSDRTNFGLFKYASLYMLSAMLLVALESI